MTAAQILSAVIFLVMFIAIIIGKVHRFVPALVGGALTILLVFLITERSPGMAYNVLNLSQLGQYKFWIPGHDPLESHGINWQTIIFILGMMTMVEGLGATGFFRWLCLWVAKLVNYRAVSILVAFTLLSGVLSMFIDSITVMLFLATVTIELARLLKFDPVPVIVAEIFASNTGGAATMSGDPPNIIIGTANGYTFMDFLKNTGPIAWAGMIVVLILFYFMFRKSLGQPASNSNSQAVRDRYPAPRDAIVNPALFKINAGIFLLAILLIVTHAQTGLSIGLVGVIAGVLALAGAGKGAWHIIRRIDWRTLLFFVGLFVTVGGLEETGALKELANAIGNVSGGSLLIVVTIILWLSGFASAIVDNIPFAATMIPVIRGLSDSGLSLPTLSWALSLGTDVGGNGTPIGASANVVGTAIAEREGYPIGWGRYCKYAVVPTLLVLGLFWVLLLVRYV
ncbi:MAG: ArsB/NhaD family transporter [Chloroflexi bacterium]|nr:ArsB/NhaD family transporter [Chloroflexota bacterium]